MTRNSDILALTVDLTPNAIFFVKDFSRTYRRANMGLAHVCGVKKQSDMVGKRATDFFEDDYVNWCDRLDHKIAEGFTLHDRIDHLHDHRGDPIWTHFSRAPVFENGERLILGVSRKLPLGKQHERSYARIKFASEAICDDLAEPPALSDLAEACACSVSQLERDFMKHLSLTPTAYRNKQRVQFVKDAIRRGDPLVQIALAAGFSDQTTLSRFFRKETGMTLGVYRSDEK